MHRPLQLVMALLRHQRVEALCALCCEMATEGHAAQMATLLAEAARLGWRLNPWCIVSCNFSQGFCQGFLCLVLEVLFISEEHVRCRQDCQKEFAELMLHMVRENRRETARDMAIILLVNK